jgi:hypothetical protein
MRLSILYLILISLFHYDMNITLSVIQNEVRQIYDHSGDGKNNYIYSFGIRFEKYVFCFAQIFLTHVRIIKVITTLWLTIQRQQQQQHQQQHNNNELKLFQKQQ